MDKVTAYGECLNAATAGIKAALAMLPNPLWGDEIDDPYVQDEVDRLDGILVSLKDATIPLDARVCRHR